MADISDVMPFTDEPEKPRYIVRDAAYALQPQPPITWIVDGVISEATVTILAGKYGCGKSWAMLNLAVCVASGKPWLGRATRQGKVLVVDEENGERRMTRRMGYCLRGELADATTPVRYISLAGFNLFNTPQDAQILQAEIENQGAQLVIIDALVDIMAGGDENSVQDTQPIILALKRIAEKTGAAIIVIHHTNKQGGFRGSTAIPGAGDNLIIVNWEFESRTMTFKSEKSRDGEPFELHGEAHWEGDAYWLTPITAVEKALTSDIGRPHYYVLKYLATHDGEAALKDIRNNADVCSGRSAHNAVYDLAQWGYVLRSDDGGGGTKAVYRLSEKGKQWVQINL